MTKRILAIVVWYNPDLDNALQNISKYVENVDSLIVWDNTPDASLQLINKKSIEKIPNAYYKSKNSNVGISVALNYAVDNLNQGEFDYLMTMDQDSEWVNFEEYITDCLSIDNDKIGAFAPNINGAFKNIERFTEDHRTITSGSLIPSRTFSLVGKYNERFFVDGIDVEFGRRIEKNGLINVRVNTAVLKQRYGEAKKRKFWNYCAPEYAPNRLYGILSSHIWILRHYKLPMNVIYEILFIYIFRFTFDIIVYQNNKLKKLKSLYLGIFDGLKK